MQQQRFAIDKKSLSGVFGHKLVAFEGGIVGAIASALVCLMAVYLLGADRVHWLWLGAFVFAVLAIASLWVLRSKIEKKASEVSEILSSGEHRLEFDPATQQFTLKIMGKVDMGVGTPSDVTIRQVKISKQEAEAVRSAIFSTQLGGSLFLTAGPADPAAAAQPAQAAA